MSVMLAYVMLVSPMALQQTAQGATQYASLEATDWSQGDRLVEYGHWEWEEGDPDPILVFVPGYDANGSVTEKITWNTNGSADRSDYTLVEEVYYEYNLQNRLAKVTTTPYEDGAPQTPTETEYKYDPDGNRVQKTVDDGTDVVVTDYLIDAYNHTGYAQVFHETTITNGDPATMTRTAYTIGDDVISQGKSDWELSLPDNWHWAAPSVQYLLYDGHGSTRQLVNSTGDTVVEDYSYDAYGVMLRDNPNSEPDPGSSATNLLYSGEQWDNSAQSYYLRARYYDPLNGRFNRMDPYAGSPQDPQSLHKYTYCHANPVNSVDPTGMFSIIKTLKIAGIISTIIYMTSKLLPPLMSVFSSAKGLYDLSNLCTMIMTLANRGIIELEDAIAIKTEALQTANDLLQSAVKAIGQIAYAVAEYYAYNMAFAAVTRVAMGGVSASVRLTKMGVARLRFGRVAIDRHHTVFKCAVKGGIRQRLFYLPQTAHTGAGTGLHARIAASRRFAHLQPRGGAHPRTMADIIGDMGAQKWLDEMGECYKWLETRDAALKGIYKMFQGAIDDIGGAAGIIDVP
jgi:RHS repeat-associated protein